VKHRGITAAGLRRVAFPAAVLVTALVAVPVAGAHAVLLRTTPANDSLLLVSPKKVTLRFNEPVESAFGSVRVYDGAASRADDGRIVRPDGQTVQVGIAGPLARGTYTVTWRVISADSHPVSGAFIFHIRSAGANPRGIASEVLGRGTPRSVRVLFDITRFFDFALLLLVAGGAVALAYPLRSADKALRGRLLFLLGIWSSLLVVVALAGIVLQGASAGGFGLGEALHWTSVSDVLQTRFGKVWLGQAILAATVAVVSFLRADERVVLLAAAPLVATPSLSGHASVSGGITLAADLAHVAAAAVWTGGLALVVVALLGAGADRWPLAARAVPRFSQLAVGSVAVLIVAGTVNAYEEVGAWRGLWDTTYGRLLLAKIALVLPLLALGAYNNRFAVPRLRRQVATPVEQRRFLRTAGAELALFAAVVAVTSVLVTEPPAKASVVPKGPYATTVALGNLEANVVVDPAKVGNNVVHFYLTDRSGRVRNLAELRVSAELASRQIGPLRYEAHQLAPGHYAVHGAQFPLAGDWQLAIQGRRGQFEALTATVSIPIRKD
jgi:copper transport protein